MVNQIAETLERRVVLMPGYLAEGVIPRLKDLLKNHEFHIFPKEVRYVDSTLLSKFHVLTVLEGTLGS